MILFLPPLQEGRESSAEILVQFDRIIQGDCIEGMNKLPEGSVDLAFADPPFNIGYAYDVYQDRKDHSAYLEWSRRWGAAVRRVLKPTGAFWLAIGDEYAAELKIVFQNALGFTCRSWVVWYYTFGVNCTKKFSRSHAHLFHFVRDPKQFTFNNDAIRVPSARQLVYADARANARGRLPDDTWILRPQDLPDGFQPDEDTWYFSRVCGTFKERAGWHGCQMPEQLLGRIIRACSNPDEVVLDPFGGSGTTLVVARKLGRRFIGFELSPDYVERINDRLAAAHPGQPLEGAEDARSSAPRTPKVAEDPLPLLRSGPIADLTLDLTDADLAVNEELGYRLRLYQDQHAAGHHLLRTLAHPTLQLAGRALRVSRALWTAAAPAHPTIIAAFAGMDAEVWRALTEGFPECWLFDLKRNTWTIHRRDGKPRVLRGAQGYESPHLPGLTLSLDALRRDLTEK